MRWGVILVCAALLAPAACYGPVRDQSRITSSVALPDGRAAIAFHEYRYRPAAGIAAFPDGGISKTVRDLYLVGLVRSDGSFRRLATFRNEALPGSGSISLRWFPEDPAHLYGARGGQQSTSLPLREFSQQVRIALDGGAIQRFDLRAQFERAGRAYGAEAFGDFAALASDGTLLVGATVRKKSEVWLRTPAGALRRLAAFDRFDRKSAHYLFYSDSGPPFTTYALDWRTGQSRPMLRYNLQNTQQEWQARSDPAYRELNGTDPAPASNEARIGDDGRSISYVRNGQELWRAPVKI